MFDVDHDHPIHVGDTVEWRYPGGALGGKSKVLTCYIMGGWAFFRLNHCEELFRFDRVKRVQGDE